MTTRLTIFHNPRCSKSRETLQILLDSNKTPEIVEYLKAPPGKQELIEIIELLGISPRELIRTSEPEYKLANPAGSSMSDDAIIEAIGQWPALLQRPIVICDGKAVIGRPPEKVREII